MRPPALQPSSLTLMGPSTLQGEGRSRPAPWRDPREVPGDPRASLGPRSPAPATPGGQGPLSPGARHARLSPPWPWECPPPLPRPQTSTCCVKLWTHDLRKARGHPSRSPAGIVLWRKRHGCSKCCTPTSCITSTHPVALVRCCPREAWGQCPPVGGIPGGEARGPCQLLQVSAVGRTSGPLFRGCGLGGWWP